MEKREIATLIFWLFLSLFVGMESWRLGLGTFISPGPGFFPFGASLVIFLFLIALFVKTRGRKLIEKSEPFFQGKNVRKAIYVLSGLFAYALLLNVIGFFLCSLVFVGFTIKKIGGQRWRVVIGTSIPVAIASYLLFVSWLGIQIPELKVVKQLFLLKGFLWR